MAVRNCIAVPRSGFRANLLRYYKDETNDVKVQNFCHQPAFTALIEAPERMLLFIGLGPRLGRWQSQSQFAFLCPEYRFDTSHYEDPGEDAHDAQP